MHAGGVVAFANADRMLLALIYRPTRAGMATTASMVRHAFSWENIANIQARSDGLGRAPFAARA
eukprot:7434656-Pyramimonas_sp.AAC.1